MKKIAKNFQTCVIKKNTNVYRTSGVLALDEAGAGFGVGGRTTTVGDSPGLPGAPVAPVCPVAPAGPGAPGGAATMIGVGSTGAATTIGLLSHADKTTPPKTPTAIIDTVVATDLNIDFFQKIKNGQKAKIYISKTCQR